MSGKTARPLILEVLKKTPKLAADVFLAPSSAIIGDVSIGKQSSVWFHCTLRGDVCPINIGERTNIQDGSTLHGTFGRFQCHIGDDVTIGHGVILHGCRIDHRVLIGMGSILLDGSHIPSDCIVGAGSLVTEGATFPSNSLILGRPARAVRELKQEEKDFLIQSAKNYILYSSWYTASESPQT